MIYLVDVVLRENGLEKDDGDSIVDHRLAEGEDIERLKYTLASVFVLLF